MGDHDEVPIAVQEHAPPPNVVNEHGLSFLAPDFRESVTEYAVCGGRPGTRDILINSFASTSDPRFEIDTQSVFVADLICDAKTMRWLYSKDNIRARRLKISRGSDTECGPWCN